MSLVLHSLPGHGAEDVVVAQDGSVLTGTEDGVIWRVSPDGRRVQRVAYTGGRPLGLELFDDGDLLVCDARRGLLIVRTATGEVEVLVDEVEGAPMRFCNNAAIASDGTIWFSDSTLHHGLEQWEDEFLQDTRSGRLLRRDVDGTVTVVMDDLAFANGVALSRDEDFVAVAETGAGTVVRWWLAGPRAGERDFLVRELPGYPDNISRGTDGLIWVTVAEPTDWLLQRLKRAPRPLRRAMVRIPERLRPPRRRTVHVQAYDDACTLIHEVDLPPDDFHMATGVREHHGRVWLGSLIQPAVAVHDLR